MIKRSNLRLELDLFGDERPVLGARCPAPGNQHIPLSNIAE
mgnify:CR=1 FL=1